MSDGTRPLLLTHYFHDKSVEAVDTKGLFLKRHTMIQHV